MADPEYDDKILKLALKEIDHIESFNKVYINPPEIKPIMKKVHNGELAAYKSNMDDIFSNMK